MKNRKINICSLMSRLLILSLLCTNTTFIGAGAEEKNGSIYVNGVEASALGYEIIDGTSMVSATELSDALSLSASWSDSMVTISGKKDKKLDMYIENNVAEINGNRCYLPAKPFVDNKRMMIPLRFTAESFGYKVAYDGENGNVYISEVKDNAEVINPQIVTFTQGGKMAERHMGQSDITQVKYTANNRDPATDRNTYYRFDVRNIDVNNTGSIFLRVYCTLTQGEFMNVVEAYGVDDEWTLETLSHNNRPQLGEKLDETVIYIPLRWYEFDITDYVKKEALGDGIASLVLTDTYGFSNKTIYAGYNNANAPHLEVYDRVVEKDNDVNNPERLENVELEGETEIVYARRKPNTPYRPYITQVTEKLKGFTMEQEVELDQYGGWITDSVDVGEKTGFFRTEKVDGRWWLVTPEGNPYISAGINCVRGSGSEWADDISEQLVNYGFNSEGGWSSRINKSDGTSVPYILIFNNFVSEYTTSQKAKTGKSYTLPVFDTAFKKFVADKVKETLKEDIINDEYLIGYVADNELHVDYDILDRFLALDANDPYAKESLDAAWSWLRQRHGDAVTADDITWRDMDDFRGYVFETYYKTVREEIEKYDKNHMYMGSRFNYTETFYSPALMSAASNQLDVITYNVYYYWTVDNAPLKKLEAEYGDKPIMVTEFYTKSEDTGMENRDGAGYVVANQRDRGKFYQNYALSLLTAKNCVGWHWFLYDDNEGRGSNKGIIDVNGKPFNELVNEMKKLNDNIYPLIEFIGSTEKKR